MDSLRFSRVKEHVVQKAAIPPFPTDSSHGSEKATKHLLSHLTGLGRSPRIPAGRLEKHFKTSKCPEWDREHTTGFCLFRTSQTGGNVSVAMAIQTHSSQFSSDLTQSRVKPSNLKTSSPSVLHPSIKMTPLMGFPAPPSSSSTLYSSTW